MANLHLCVLQGNVYPEVCLLPLVQSESSSGCLGPNLRLGLQIAVSHQRSGGLIDCPVPSPPVTEAPLNDGTVGTTWTPQSSVSV